MQLESPCASGERQTATSIPTAFGILQNHLQQFLRIFEVDSSLLQGFLDIATSQSEQKCHDQSSQVCLNRDLHVVKTRSHRKEVKT